jgi:CO/xanthine dehydrogenase Mo-binding subunit
LSGASRCSDVNELVHYDNATTYAAVVGDMTGDRQTGHVYVPRVAVAHDCGLIVSPDEVAITLLNRPDQPMVGAGKATTSPIAAAIETRSSTPLAGTFARNR